jgi:hypothetical protein
MAEDENEDEDKEPLDSIDDEEQIPGPALYTTARDPKKVYLDKVREELPKVAQKFNVLLTEGQDCGVYQFRGNQSTRCGNRPIELQTKYNNECMYRQAWRFCALKGDYESMLILACAEPTRNVPAMRLETVEEFLRFKRKPKNLSLFKTGSREHVKDTFGSPITTDGGWKAPKNEWIYSAAISDLHKANNFCGEYTDICTDCQAKPASQLHTGCIHHSGLPRLTRKGNPCDDECYKNAKKEMQKLGKNYVEVGSMQLLPVDLRMLRTHLLSTPCVTNLQVWVIIIMATLLFLRHDEFHIIAAAAFQSAMFSIPDATKIVESLVLTVCGKADKKWVYLRLYADHEYPELCPVRPLLVYLYTIKWRGGYIFPSPQELHNPPSDGVYTTTICHATLNRQIQELCRKVLQPRSNMKVGCQTWRKTGYCLAIFGDADRDDLKMSARHSKKSKDAPTYSKDAAGSYQMQKQNPNPLNSVREWTNIVVQNTGNAEIMAILSGSRFTEFRDLPEFFIRECLGIGAQHPRAQDAHFLLECAANYVTNDEPEKQFQQEVKDMHPNKKRKLETIVGRLVIQRTRAVVCRSHGPGPVSLAMTTMAMPPASKRLAADGDGGDDDGQASLGPTRPISTSTKNDFPERHGLKQNGLNALEKIKTMLSIYKKHELRPRILTEGAKSFFKKFLHPAINCLNNHFDGDVEAFARRYPNFKHTLFPKQCCKGRGPTCSL